MTSLWQTLSHIPYNLISCASVWSNSQVVMPRILHELCTLGGGHWGLLETENPRKKSLKTAKPQ